MYEAHGGTSTQRVHDSKTRKERQFSWVRRAKGKAFRLPTRVCTRVQAGGLTATTTQAGRRTRRRKGHKGKAGRARGSSAAAPAGVRLDSMVGTQASAVARWQRCSSTRLKAQHHGQGPIFPSARRPGSTAARGTTVLTLRFMLWWWAVVKTWGRDGGAGSRSVLLVQAI
jgi:hypothetical protein